MIGIAIVGYGYWGPQLARNIAAVDGCRLLAVCDAAESRLALARVQHPGIRCCTALAALLDDARIDAVVIATPVCSHYELARACLAAGRHVLVEKPVCATSAQAHALAAEATLRKRVLLVDHTYLYSGAVAAIAAAIDRGELGAVQYYDAVRINLGRFRTDVDVLWDLASHDLAILDHLFPDQPGSVQAMGFARTPGAPCEFATLNLRWGEHRIAQVHVSWLAPGKVRRILVGGSRGLLRYDYLDGEARVRLFDAAAPGSSADDRARALPCAAGEPLRNLVEHFVACIATGCRPRSDGAAGARVVTWLEAAHRSLAQGGAPVAPGDTGAARQGLAR